MSKLDHGLRHGRITGSLAAACLGFDPWTTPLAAWVKIRERVEDNPIDYTADQLPPMARGHVLEPALMLFGAHVLTARTGRTTITFDEPTRPHHAVDWAAASVDARYLLTANNGELPECHLGEGKTVAWTDPHSAEWGSAWTDEVPRHVAIQCQFNMWHYGDARGVVVPTLIGSGLTLRCYYVPRDDAAIAALADVLERWHFKHIVSGEQPTPRAGDLEIIAKAFPKPVLINKGDDPSVAVLAEADMQLRDQIKELGEQREEVRAQIGGRMQDYEICEGPWGRVTFRPKKSPARTDYQMAMRTLAMLMSADLADKGERACLDIVWPEFDADAIDAMIDEAIRRNTSRPDPIRELRTWPAKGE